ncbi:hypothetical protein GGTG_05329 [Gaeumannomyces tritici R3-111a-1]|uniref:Uncharacterized protein n=1 Tax=Gaeumannomyces tritici (strain R3-111a-1) TaxID=644352 RepID=J3NVL4_GAET3|nr:hypothetical protein GGTG_05329 [Gaeumannomyces tritici R3-111a-1]EJT75392.1 hypothetical protein GGTG_05329 [Gaeumannomyces tritici R3-111a-1]
MVRPVVLGHVQLRRRDCLASILRPPMLPLEVEWGGGVPCLPVGGVPSPVSCVLWLREVGRALFLCLSSSSFPLRLPSGLWPPAGLHPPSNQEAAARGLARLGGRVAVTAPTRPSAWTASADPQVRLRASGAMSRVASRSMDMGQGSGHRNAEVRAWEYGFGPNSASWGLCAPGSMQERRYTPGDALPVVVASASLHDLPTSPARCRPERWLKPTAIDHIAKANAKTPPKPGALAGKSGHSCVPVDGTAVPARVPKAWGDVAICVCPSRVRGLVNSLFWAASTQRRIGRDLRFQRRQFQTNKQPLDASIICLRDMCRNTPFRASTGSACKGGGHEGYGAQAQVQAGGLFPVCPAHGGEEGTKRRPRGSVAIRAVA